MSESYSFLIGASHLIVQLAIIIALAWLSDIVTNKLSLPNVIGYIVVGIIIGPYVLGSLPLGDLMPEGLFSEKVAPNTAGSIYYISVIASVVLLFVTGLETDVGMFVRYAGKSSIVGSGEIVVAFFGGYLVSLAFFPDLGYFHPTHLFMGSISTATSVGISSSILSSQKKTSSPEGVTILAAAVFDDVVGIIILAVVTGIAEISKTGEFHASQIVFITVKAVGLWLGCTAIGIMLAKRISGGLKKVIFDGMSLAVFVLGLAFFVGGLFEASGISMLTGAYIVGLTFSNTDISHSIQDKLAPISLLLIPVFFVVSGMSIDIKSIVSPAVLVFGLAYSVACILAKFFGAGGFALFAGFTPMGASRVGAGMIPHGEVSLVIATIGLGAGWLNNTMYSAVMMMIITSAFSSSLLLNALLKIKAPGSRHADTEANIARAEIDLKHEQLGRFIIANFVNMLEEEKFFINKTTQPNKVLYDVRKDNVFMIMQFYPSKGKLILSSNKQNIPYFNAMMYEASTSISELAETVKQDIQPSQMLISRAESRVVRAKKSSKEIANLAPLLSPKLVNLSLKGASKNAVIKEMVAMLEKDGCLSDSAQFLQDVFERERSFSTGMQNGIALPHARSEACTVPRIVIAVKPKGLDFESLDKKPSVIFVLMATPKNYPHVSVLAKISALLGNPSFRTKLLACTKESEAIALFTTEAV